MTTRRGRRIAFGLGVIWSLAVLLWGFSTVDMVRGWFVRGDGFDVGSAIIVAVDALLVWLGRRYWQIADEHAQA